MDPNDRADTSVGTARAGQSMPGVASLMRVFRACSVAREPAPRRLAVIESTIRREQGKNSLATGNLTGNLSESAALCEITLGNIGEFSGLRDLREEFPCATEQGINSRQQ
jgi:hypothetical protein